MIKIYWTDIAENIEFLNQRLEDNRAKGGTLQKLVDVKFGKGMSEKIDWICNEGRCEFARQTDYHALTYIIKDWLRGADTKYNDMLDKSVDILKYVKDYLNGDM